MPLTAAALFIRVEKVDAQGRPMPKRLKLIMARPTSSGYLIKELIEDMGKDAEAAVEKALDIARRGNVGAIYLNADIEKLPAPVSQTG